MGSVFKIIFYLERYMLNVESPLGTYCKLGHKIHAFGPCISLCLWGLCMFLFYKVHR